MDSDREWSLAFENGQQLLRAGRKTEGERLVLDLIARAEQFPPNDNRLVVSMECLAEHYFCLNAFAKAEPLVKRIIQRLQATLGPEHQDLGNSINNLGLLYHRQKKYFMAETEYQKALTILGKTLGSAHVQTANTVANYAKLLRETHRHQAAQKLEAENCPEQGNWTKSGVYKAYNPPTRQASPQRRTRDSYQAHPIVVGPLTGTLATQLANQAMDGELVTLQDIAIPEQIKAQDKPEIPNKAIPDGNKPANQSPESAINRQGEGLMRILRDRRAN
ncbi:MAG: tetratricopeptide repeat protein [Candidatus Obscuribacter sp.]|nr:tetratricopeptide repeat protein [Candidatus Obscuribacter sp.]